MTLLAIKREMTQFLGIAEMIEWFESRRMNIDDLRSRFRGYVWLCVAVLRSSLLKMKILFRRLYTGEVHALVKTEERGRCTYYLYPREMRKYCQPPERHT